ncbi:hypothetical protein [Roseibium sp. SCP14]|uniref:hypothetical protein n=1 Tax=Roseibium sp. SCP14 TaxID=3141375 RepID=UPI0033364AB1
MSAEADATGERLERRAAQLKRETGRLVDHLANGVGDPQVIGSRSTELHYEREDILVQLSEASPVFEVVSLHPAILKRYEQQLETLQQALAAGIRSGDNECAQAMRELVETVTVLRDTSPPGAVEIEVKGRSWALLGERHFPNGIKGSGGSMVAEGRLEPPKRGSNLRFSKARDSSAFSIPTFSENSRIAA